MSKKLITIEWECAICLKQKSTDAVMPSTPCMLDGCQRGKHIFCESCIRLSADKSQTCPTCRGPFTHIIPIQVIPGSEPIKKNKKSDKRNYLRRFYYQLQWAWDCEKSERFYLMMTVLAFLTFAYVLNKSSQIHAWLVQRLPLPFVTFSMGAVFLITTLALLMTIAPMEQNTKKRINTFSF